MSVLIFAKVPSVARAVARGLESRGRSVVVDSHTNIEDMRSVIRRADEVKATVVIHAAGQDDGDPARIDADLAFARNAESPIHVAAAALKHRAVPILISSSVVFGKRGGPYSEEDGPSPSNTISESRHRGETLFLRTSPKAIVLRVGHVLSDGLENEARRLDAHRAESPELSSVVAGFDLGVVIDVLVSNGAAGLFHVASASPVGRFQLYQEISKALGRDPGIVKSDPAPLTVPAPPMLAEKLRPWLEKAPGGAFRVRDWRQAVADLGRAPSPVVAAPTISEGAGVGSAEPSKVEPAKAVTAEPGVSADRPSEVEPSKLGAPAIESSRIEPSKFGASAVGGSKVHAANIDSKVESSREGLVEPPPSALPAQTSLDVELSAPEGVSMLVVRVARGQRRERLEDVGCAYVLVRGKALLEIGAEPRDVVMRPITSERVLSGERCVVHAIEDTELLVVAGTL